MWMKGTKRDEFEHKTILLAKTLGPEDPGVQSSSLYMDLCEPGKIRTIGIYRDLWIIRVIGSFSFNHEPIRKP